MRIVFKQLLILLSFFLSFHVILLLWAHTLYRYEPFNHIDTKETASIRDTLKYYTYPATLMNPGKKLILFGSSNTLNSFLPGELAPLLRGYAVFNMARGSANIAQARRELDFVYRMLSSEQVSEATFVLGIWYGLFFNSRYPDSAYYLFKEKDMIKQPIVPYRYHSAIVYMIYPYVIINMHYKNTIKFISRIIMMAKSFLFGSEWLKSDEERDDERNATITSEQIKVYMLQRWGSVIDISDDALRNDLFEKITHDQFDQLDQLIQLVEHKGNQIILADLPLAQWHQERSAHFKFYQQKKKLFLSNMQKKSRMLYINLQDSNNQDEDFYDGTHLKPKMTAAWSQQLANKLNPLLSK